MLHILVVCVLVLATQVSGTCKSDLTEVEQTVLDNVNMYRRKFEDTPDLCYGASDSSHTYSSESWSRTLSNTEAQHGMRNSGQAGVDETLFWFCVESEPLTRNYVIAAQVWYNQVQYYQYDHPSYAEDQRGYLNLYLQCKQFLTMLGPQVREVNCGHALSDGSNGNKGFFIVCQFYPGTTYQTATIQMQRPKNSNEFDEYAQMLKDRTAERKAAYMNRHNTDEDTDYDNSDTDYNNRADSSNAADTEDQSEAGSLIGDMLADTKMLALEAFLVFSVVSVALVYKYRHTTVGGFFAGIPSAMFRCARKTGYKTVDGGKDCWFETKLKWKHREYSGI